MITITINVPLIIILVLDCAVKSISTHHKINIVVCLIAALVRATVVPVTATPTRWIKLDRIVVSAKDGAFYDCTSYHNGQGDHHYIKATRLPDQIFG